VQLVDPGLSFLGGPAGGELHLLVGKRSFYVLFGHYTDNSIADHYDPLLRPPC